MARVVRCSLIQAKNEVEPGLDGGGPSLAEIKQAMIDKHVKMIRTAAADGAQIVCLQEIFYGPYFCAEQTTRWYDSTERVPEGPTVQRMMGLAKELGVPLPRVYDIVKGKRSISAESNSTTRSSASTARGRWPVD